MTIAADFTAYGMASKKVSATSTSTLLTGTSGLCAEAIPSECTHLAILPAGTGVYLAFGTASVNTVHVPVGGMVINSPSLPALRVIQLYAAATTVCQIMFGGNNGKIVLGTSFSIGEINIGNVGLLDAAESEIDPSEAQAANTAYAAADKLTPLGGVKSATRHTAAELETFADDDYVPIGATDVHELRVRDDDANTLLAVGTGVMASAQAVTVATDDTVVGATDAAAVDGDTAGSLSAKLRGINKVLALMDADTSILAAGGGGGLTFTRVPFITAGAATTELLAKTGSQTQRLHKLVFTCSAAALVEVEDKDGGVLATWNVGANGGIVDPFTPHASGCIQQSVVNKGLQIVNSAGNLGGYAVVSTGA